MMKSKVTMLGVILLTSCSNPAPDVNSVEGGNSSVAEATHAAPCPDISSRLPLSDLCEADAVRSLTIVGGEVGGDAPILPPACHWAVNEARFASDIVLYMAASCDGKKAALEFAGGAHFSALNLVWSAVAGQAFEDNTLIRISGGDMEEPYDNILFQARQALDNPALAPQCHVRPAAMGGWPSDAVVVDISPDQAAKAPQDEPRSACGMFGYDENNTSYWRLFQGYSWWFQYSQDAYQDIDPRTLTLLHPDGDGGWKVAP